MMERDKVEELIAYLKSLGFKGEKLEEDIRTKYQLHEDAFIVKHHRMFGEELMEYELSFLRDWQFVAYRLEGYIARHRLPITIAHELINGIDTKMLEKRMASVDWERYFQDFDNDQLDNSSIPQIQSDLLQLTAMSDSRGEYIQSQLIFKYYPREKWDDSAKEVGTKYEEERTFTVEKHGISNAILAYNTISGRLDKLFDKIGHIRLGSASDFNLYDHLKHYLSRDPFLFDLYFSAAEKEGVVDYHIRVIKDEDGFEPEQISSTLTRYPDFLHGVYNNVDTEKLEEKMRQIRWEDPNALFTPYPSGDALMRTVAIAAIMEDLYKLANSSQLDVATYLCMKYVWKTEELHDYIAGSIYDRHSDLPTLSADFSSENRITGISMYNLLCGRPVKDKSGKATDTWLLAKSDPQTADRSLIITKVKGLTEGQLKDLFDVLPLKSYINDYRIRQSLMSGNVEETELVNGKQILISIGSDGKNIELHTPDMKPIPFNFHFDADWQPAELKALQAQVLSSDEKSKPQKKEKSKSRTHKIK